MCPSSSFSPKKTHPRKKPVVVKLRIQPYQPIWASQRGEIISIWPSHYSRGHYHYHCFSPFLSICLVNTKYLPPFMKSLNFCQPLISRPGLRDCWSEFSVLPVHEIEFSLPALLESTVLHRSVWSRVGTWSQEVIQRRKPVGSAHLLRLVVT